MDKDHGSDINTSNNFYQLILMRPLFNKLLIYYIIL